MEKYNIYNVRLNPGIPGFEPMEWVVDGENGFANYPGFWDESTVREYYAKGWGYDHHREPRYTVTLESISEINAIITALHSRIAEKREIYARCKEGKPYYPAECSRIGEEIQTLNKVLAEIEDYKMEGDV